MNYIEIDKNKIPHNFNITLGAELFNIAFNYNKREDLFTVDLKNADGEVLVKGEPVLYGTPLFNSVQNMNFPIVKLIPKDTSLTEKEVTFDNFNETVLLMVGDDNG